MRGVHCPSRMGSGGQHVPRLKKEGNQMKCAGLRSLPDESAFRCASVSRGASWGLLTTNVPHKTTKRKKVRISPLHSLPICICHPQELVVIPFATPTLWKQLTTLKLNCAVGDAVLMRSQEVDKPSFLCSQDREHWSSRQKKKKQKQQQQREVSKTDCIH